MKRHSLLSLLSILLGFSFASCVTYNWKLLPADWVQEAEKRDYQLLFGE